LAPPSRREAVRDHAFVTSGPGQLLSVLLATNVEGGFGVVGSARHGARSIAMAEPSAGR